MSQFLQKFARKLGKTGNMLTFAEAGTVQAASFTGSPRKATVTLQAAQPSASYAVTVTGSDARSWTVESLTTTGFIISSNADAALTGPVFWSIGGDL